MSTSTLSPVNDEWLLMDEEDRSRYVIFPIKHNDIWSMYKLHVSAFWTPEEVDLSKDMADWEKLTSQEQYFIKHILAFFAASDGIVNENLSLRFINEVKVQEVKAFYGFQIAMENIHCVSGDTEVLTDKGYNRIEYLAKREPRVKVWNGDEFSDVQVVQTSPSADIFRVRLSNGMSLDCTSQHKWVIKDMQDRVYTKDLQAGMLLPKFTYPNIIDTFVDGEIFQSPFDHGKEAGSFENPDSSYDMLKYNMRAKYDIPMNYSKKTTVSWLSGFFDTKHSVLRHNIQSSMEDVLTIKHSKKELLTILQMLLTHFGVESKFDGRGFVHGDGDVLVWALTLDIHNVIKLIDAGVTLEDPEFKDALTQYLKDNDHLDHSDHSLKKMIVSITPLHVKKPTFCFNEPKKHIGFFNGIMTGQSETYSLLIDTYIKDIEEKTRMLNAVEMIPCVKKKAEWAIKWISSSQANFATRLVAFACVEGIFFSGSFCSIFWLKERGLMPGLCTSNEFISRDEGLHTEFACLLYSHVVNKLSQSQVHEIVVEAVMIENEFINESLPCNLLGMNAELMNQYIKFVADRLTFQLGYEKIWDVQNPFDFMNRISLENKSNFFEHTRVSEYAKANVAGEIDNGKFEFSIEEDF